MDRFYIMYRRKRKAFKIQAGLSKSLPATQIYSMPM
jgi:hypothetical protein